MLKNKTALSMVVFSVLIAACQPKNNEQQSTDTEQVSSSAQSTALLSLQGGIEKIKLQVPECKGKNCPEFSVERLHSNQFVLDEVIDQAIIASLKRMLSTVEHDALAEKNQQPQTASEQQRAEQRSEQQQAKSKSDSQSQSASEALGNRIAKTPAQLFSEQVQPYFNTFLSLDKELKTLGVNHQINLMISPRILNSMPPLATVVINSSSYLGGAHGSSAQTYYNFDLERQKQVELKDVLQANQMPQLDKLAHAAFKEWVKESKLADNVVEYEQAWKFKLSDNFYLGQQGLILQYAEYEIGPYVVGLPRLMIPYEQLKGILKPVYFPEEMQLDQPASSALTSTTSTKKAP